MKRLPEVAEIANMTDLMLQQVRAVLIVDIAAMTDQLSRPREDTEEHRSWRIHANHARRLHGRTLSMVNFTLSDRGRTGSRGMRLEAVQCAAREVYRISMLSDDDYDDGADAAAIDALGVALQALDERA